MLFGGCRGSSVRRQCRGGRGAGPMFAGEVEELPCELDGDGGTVKMAAGDLVFGQNVLGQRDSSDIEDRVDLEMVSPGRAVRLENAAKKHADLGEPSAPLIGD